MIRVTSGVDTFRALVVALFIAFLWPELGCMSKGTQQSPVGAGGGGPSGGSAGNEAAAGTAGSAADSGVGGNGAAGVGSGSAGADATQLLVDATAMPTKPVLTNPVLDGAYVYFINFGNVGANVMTQGPWGLSRVPKEGGAIETLASAPRKLWRYAGSDSDHWYAIEQTENLDPTLGDQEQPDVVSFAQGQSGFTVFAQYPLAGTGPLIAAQTDTVLFVSVTLDTTASLFEAVEGLDKPGPDTVASWKLVNADPFSMSIGQDNLLHWASYELQSDNTTLVTTASSPLNKPQVTIDGNLPSTCRSCVRDPAGTAWFCLCYHSLGAQGQDLVQILPSGATHVLQGGLNLPGIDVAVPYGFIDGSFVFEVQELVGGSMDSAQYTKCDTTSGPCQAPTRSQVGAFAVDSTFIYYQDVDGSLGRVPSGW
jgi:hypothetical protein